jgi:hypothetical protein
MGALTWRVMTPNPGIDPDTFGFEWESPGQTRFTVGLGRADVEKLRDLLNAALQAADPRGRDDARGGLGLGW